MNIDFPKAYYVRDDEARKHEENDDCIIHELAKLPKYPPG